MTEPSETLEASATVPASASASASETTGLVETAGEPNTEHEPDSGIEYSILDVLECIDSAKVLGIVYWGRSGSFFLHSLFDSHPEVLSLVPHFTGDYLTVLWPKLTAQPLTLEYLIDAFMAESPYLFDSKLVYDKVLGERQDEGYQFEAADFKQAMQLVFDQLIQRQPGLEVTRALFFRVAHVVYAMLQQRDLSRIRAIVYQLHHPQMHSVQAFLEAFPDGQLLATYRNHGAALNSHCKMQLSFIRNGKRFGYPVTVPERYQMEDLVFDGIYAFYYRHQLLGWTNAAILTQIRMIAVELETLHAEPEATMRDLCARLELRWDDCLLRSTINNLAYTQRYGEAGSAQEKAGFSKDHAKSGDQERYVSERDEYVLNRLIAHRLARLPGRIERLATPAPAAWTKYILMALIMLPTRYETRAAIHALKLGQEPLFQSVILAYLDRCLFSFRYLFDEVMDEGSIGPDGLSLQHRLHFEFNQLKR